VKLVLDLTKKVEKKALEEEVPPGLTRREVTIKAVYDELVSLLGGEKPPSISYPKGKSTVIMLVGIQGSGKTTSAAKLAYFLKKHGYRPGLVCADSFRPGAYHQLKQLAEQVGVPFYGELGKDSITLAKNGVKKLKEQGVDIVIVDTAGRHKNEKDLIEEMKNIAEAISPNEIMMVIDATIGQQAASQASAFHEATKIGSIFLTKLDGAARGGGALSAVASTGASIKFIGVGEKIEDIELFSPTSFVSRLLGMGDIQAIIEKVKELERLTSKKTIEAMASGRFTLKDLYTQLQSLRKMGPLAKVLQALPGFGFSISKEIEDLTEAKMKRWLAIMQSMTEEELKDPSIIDSSRMKRIARGAGVTTKDVRELLDQYRSMKKLVKQLVKKQKRLAGLPFFKGADKLTSK
ncbi:MAG: signal recognition particle protein, partial [Candidatus Methanomethylicota archaeon]